MGQGKELAKIWHLDQLDPYGDLEPFTPSYKSVIACVPPLGGMQHNALGISRAGCTSLSKKDMDRTLKTSTIKNTPPFSGRPLKWAVMNNFIAPLPLYGNRSGVAVEVF